MKLKSKILIVGIASFLVTLWGVAASVSGKVLKQSSVSCPKRSLQAAVETATPRETIFVAGVCNEQVVIRVNGLTLDGSGTAIIDGTDLGDIIGGLVEIRADNVTIKGFTIQNAPPGVANSSGITVRNSASAIIHSNTVQNSAGTGIVVTSNSFARIGAGPGSHLIAGEPGSQGNTIQNNGGNGISVRTSSGADIRHNRIIGHSRAISVREAGAADIDGNEIIFNNIGIRIVTNGVVRLSAEPGHNEPNLIEDNGVGVTCFLGGAIGGNPQDFGSGNTVNTQNVGTCSVSNSLGF